MSGSLLIPRTLSETIKRGEPERTRYAATSSQEIKISLSRQDPQELSGGHRSSNTIAGGGVSDVREDVG